MSASSAERTFGKRAMSAGAAACLWLPAGPRSALAKLCESHDLASVDFLKIDVEGAEGDVVFGGDWKRFRPKVVVARGGVADGVGAFMAGLGAIPCCPGLPFRPVRTLNRFYVADEHPGIMARLPSGP